MNKILLFVLIGLLVHAVWAEVSADEVIRDLIIHSGTYIDNPKAGMEEFRGAKELCGGDTNRFARILCELAQTNTTRLADRMIRCLGKYGTTAQLPFLYSMATNEQHGAAAVKSILRLEGVTSNSVAIAGAYLSMTNVDFEYRADVCKTLLRTTAQDSVSPIMRQVGRDCALRYARSANRYVWDVDTVFIETDPTYRNSRRRIEVLRAAFRLGVSQYQIAYVTNAINELVAYPEADLPE